jgi:hypothetical protein
MLASSALLVAVTGAALAQRSFALAAYLALASLVPFSPRERHRAAGVLLASAGIAWCLFETVRVPLGSRVTAVLLPACAALAARIWALGSESALRWAHPRWAQGLAAPPLPLAEALEAALKGGPQRSPPPALVDAAVAALAAAEPSAIPEGEADRRAFWINAHNVIAAHAGRFRRSPSRLDALEVLRTAYAIAGVPLTPADIRRDLLRGGADGAAVAGSRWAVPLDPRVHFALSDGALSSPPMRFYRGIDLDAELDRAAQSFLAASSAVDEASGIIETTSLLRTHARDLGGEPGARALLARALGIERTRLDTWKLRYRPFDWTSAI